VRNAPAANLDPPFTPCKPDADATSGPTRRSVVGTLHSLSHTADVGFEVEAASLDELFELSVGGLLACLGATSHEESPGDEASDREPLDAKGPERKPAQATEGRMELDRPDLERLLVAWLRELLYRATETSSVPRVASLRVESAGDGPARLEADLRWEPMEGGPTREIKGVTYHGLDVARGADDRWHARVLLDV
jgi:SHS2 domain-containing protein